MLHERLFVGLNLIELRRSRRRGGNAAVLQSLETYKFHISHFTLHTSHFIHLFHDKVEKN
jgi:hypothetical protein